MSGDDDEPDEDHRVGGGMGIHAKGNHKAKNNFGRASRAAIQLRGVHDALYVSFVILFLV